jgi:threonine aldolase
VPTNIVMFDLSPEFSVDKFIRGMNKKGVKVGSRGGNRFRAVTHRMISAEDVDEALERIDTVVHSLQ